MSWAEVQVIKDKISSMGYPPKAMSSYNVQAASGGKVKLYFTPPPNTYIKDQEEKAVPLVQIGGIMIRKKAGSRITSLTDGELLENIPAEDMFNYTITPYVDEDVEIGTKYFYRFFPYSTVGMYNTQDDSQYGVTVTEEGSMLVFGFDQDFRDLNPDTQITYPDDVENHSYAPMVVLGDETERTCGGWRYFLEGVLHNAPYMVKRNGEADYELDHINYKYKINGEASDWNDTNYQGMAMSWISRMYKKEWYTDEGEVRHVRFCEGVPIDEDPADWIPVGCYADDEPNENIKRGFFIPIGGLRNALGIYNRLNTPIVTSDTFYSVYYFSKIKDANDFINNIDNENEAFSTIFTGPVLRLLKDYLKMLLKTSNVYLATGGDDVGGADIESGDSVTPGFECSENNLRIFYSYILRNKNVSLISPYYLDGFLYSARGQVYKSGSWYIGTNHAYTNARQIFASNYNLLHRYASNETPIYIKNKFMKTKIENQYINAYADEITYFNGNADIYSYKMESNYRLNDGYCNLKTKVYNPNQLLFNQIFDMSCVTIGQPVNMRIYTNGNDTSAGSANYAGFISYTSNRIYNGKAICGNKLCQSSFGDVFCYDTNNASNSIGACEKLVKTNMQQTGASSGQAWLTVGATNSTQVQSAFIGGLSLRQYEADEMCEGGMYHNYGVSHFAGNYSQNRFYFNDSDFYPNKLYPLSPYSDKQIKSMFGVMVFPENDYVPYELN